MSSSLHSAHYQVFRDLLIEARERVGLTQVQVAGLLEKPQSFVSKYERGERRLDFTEFMEIAVHLNIDVQKLIKTYKTKISVNKNL
jgi:transcriptional regulator with XRE-family HTH domain